MFWDSKLLADIGCKFTYKYLSTLITLSTPSGFVRAHFLTELGILQIVEDFDNFLSISTLQQNIGDVLVDGNSVPLLYWTNIGSYSVAAFPVTPGFHTVSTVAGSGAKIAAWSYGHSRFFEGTSAYGYATVYESTYRKQ